MQEVVLFYNGLDVPTGQIIDSKGAIPTKTAADAKDVNNVKAPTTPKISHSKKKGKPSEKLTTLNLVHPFREGDIEQLLQDSTKGTMQILRASVSVMPLSTFLNLGLGELAHTKLTVDLVDRVLKYPKGIAENVLVGIELKIDQVDDLMLTIKEGEVGDEFRARNNARMVLNSYTLNVISKKFCNSIRKDKLEYKGNNVVGALMNIPIFVGSYSILTDFTVSEDMDAYRDEGMSNVIFGEPFLREVGIKARRLDGMITIYNSNEM
uniref:Uncharacterized protein n=1 Tax=Tanacetum cinerariifolium TaxID=118510 RepID=A0A6L2KSR2_TANCI|nr:hypothetical protein [Tanacetum cinerariifolium]